MTNSDNLMIAAVKAQVSFRVNGRSVGVDDEKTVVRLFDREIMRLSFIEGKVTLNGDAPVSRKSTRVFNAVLREFTDFSMQSRDGQWILCGPFGTLTPVGSGRISVPMKTEYRYDRSR